jgi:hypothetical protein
LFSNPDTLQEQLKPAKERVIAELTQLKNTHASDDEYRQKVAGNHFFFNRKLTASRCLQRM